MIITQPNTKNFLFLLFLCTTMGMYSFAQSKKTYTGNAENGHYMIEKQKLKNTDSSYLDIEVLGANANKHLQSPSHFEVSDVWLNNYRYKCDSTGHVKIRVEPGRYELTARCLGLKNISNIADVKKGEVLIIKYYPRFFNNYEPQRQHGIKKRTNI